MRMCYCKIWQKKIEDYGEFRLATLHKDSDITKIIRFAQYCPWCGKPLGESKSQQNRLEIQLKEKKDA